MKYPDSALWPIAPNLPRETRNELGHPAIYYETCDPKNLSTPGISDYV